MYMYLSSHPRMWRYEQTLKPPYKPGTIWYGNDKIWCLFGTGRCLPEHIQREMAIHVRLMKADEFRLSIGWACRQGSTSMQMPIGAPLTVVSIVIFSSYGSTKVNCLGSRAAVGYFGKEYAFAIRPRPMSQGLIAAFSTVRRKPPSIWKSKGFQGARKSSPQQHMERWRSLHVRNPVGMTKLAMQCVSLLEKAPGCLTRDVFVAAPLGRLRFRARLSGVPNIAVCSTEILVRFADAVCRSACT